MALFSFKSSIPVWDAPSAQEKLSWLRLARTDNVGPVTFYRLLQTYGSASRALEMLPSLAKRGGRAKPLTPPDAGSIEREYAALVKMGGDILCAADPSYPSLLAAIDDAPPVLSILGDASLLTKPCIGIVGARNASLNGRKFAQNLAQDLGKNNHVVVSGLARGIDTAAHVGSLATGTIAVVAGGIDVVYPEENQKLYADIRERGLIIAESPLSQKPFAQSFPRRNRIVSGLCRGVVVVEATMRSGSLITARLAGEQGREVFAVPGHPLDPRAEGPNHLIREGVTLIRNADDVLEAIRSLSGHSNLSEPPAPTFDWENLPTANTASEEPSESLRARIIDHLSFEAVSVDEIIRECEISVSQAQIILLELELAGRLKRHPGNRVSLLG